MSLVTDLRRNASEVSTTQHIQVLRPKDINAFLLKKGYKLGKVIGEGSYSKVRICVRNSQEAEKPRSPIACKIIDKRRASEDFVDKFLPRELEIVGRLKHPNIVEVLNVVEHLHNVFIFMDYCDKGDLLDYIKKQGFLPEALSRHYFKQILMAVHYLHSMDLTHRDLKCENVLLTKNDHVKLSDFGFARACRDVGTGKRILSNTYCGSAAYAAPEILQGTQYNPKLYDMWSAGCILFIMLTGHMPFDESDVPRMLHMQLQAILTYPSLVENLISPFAKNYIRHLLEPDVTRRATVDQALANPWLDMDTPETEGDFRNMRARGSSNRNRDHRFDQGDSYNGRESQSSIQSSHSQPKPRRLGTPRHDQVEKSTSTNYRSGSSYSSNRKDRKHQLEPIKNNKTDDTPLGDSNTDSNGGTSVNDQYDWAKSENPSAAHSKRNRGSFKQ